MLSKKDLRRDQKMFIKKDLEKVQRNWANDLLGKTYQFTQNEMHETSEKNCTDPILKEDSNTGIINAAPEVYATRVGTLPWISGALNGQYNPKERIMKKIEKDARGYNADYVSIYMAGVSNDPPLLSGIRPEMPEGAYLSVRAKFLKEGLLEGKTQEQRQSHWNKMAW